jgi:capsular exopolysaccharide synthesis family protein
MCGLAIGIALCLLNRNTGRGMQFKETGVPMGYRGLGAIPYAFETRRSWLGLKEVEGTAGSAAGQEVSVLGPELASLTGEQSPVAESARAALQALLLPASPDDQPRVLAITSAGEGEGKTTLACNFALALSQMNQRVLLVDGNARGPKLYEIFGIPNRPGFSDLIAQSRSAAEGAELEWRHAADLSELGMAGLHVLPAGTARAAGLLCSPQLPAVFERLRRQFDFVVIDAPPLSRLEARALARAADGVVLVVGARQTSHAAVDAGLERLTEDGTRVLGIVVNDRGARRVSLLPQRLGVAPAPLRSLQEGNLS